MRKWLAEKNIPSMVYYPIPLHWQKAYASADFPKGSLPVTEQLCACVISLPISTEMSPDQLEYIVQHVKDYCKEFAK
jgi:dTDP-4-amino-4,6-dideoxygalactose transaminase